MEQVIDVEKLYDAIEERVNNNQPEVKVGSKTIKAGTALRALDSNTWQTVVGEEIHFMIEMGLISETNEVFKINFSENALLEMFKNYNKKE